MLWAGDRSFLGPAIECGAHAMHAVCRWLMALAGNSWHVNLSRNCTFLNCTTSKWVSLLDPANRVPISEPRPTSLESTHTEWKKMYMKIYIFLTFQTMPYDYANAMSHSICLTSLPFDKGGFTIQHRKEINSSEISWIKTFPSVTTECFPDNCVPTTADFPVTHSTPGPTRGYQPIPGSHSVATEQRATTKRQPWQRWWRWWSGSITQATNCRQFRGKF